MTRAVARAGLCAGLLCLFASAAAGQDTGWDLAVDPAGSLIQASVTYEGGLGMVVQCRDGTFDMAVTGLPPGPVHDGNRTLSSGRADRDPEDIAWRADATGSVLFHPSAPRATRALRRAGVYLILIPAQDGTPARQIAFALPSDPTGLDRTLDACGQRTVNPRDDMPTVDEFLAPDWGHSRLFEPNLTGRMMRGGVDQMTAQISCIVAPRGRVEQCEIESETSPERGYGAAVLADAPNVRLDLGTNEAAAVGRVFRMGMASSRIRRR